MQLFNCSNCGQPVYFENTHCEQCKYPLGFIAETLRLVSLKIKHNNVLHSHGRRSKPLYRYCSNHQYDVCNWLVPANEKKIFCKACELNRTIPNLSEPEYRVRWTTIERAKHRLIYQLLRMKLPLQNKSNGDKGLAFDFMADINTSENERILTGHNNGIITINIAEADDIEREMARRSMNEIYRTVLGHFRHEIGHYYWNVLIENSDKLGSFRKLFGDERVDYGEALNRHYREGAPANWKENFISAYSTMHPWEDWAETWAHYMHIIDTLETAYSFGMRLKPNNIKKSAQLRTEIKTDPYRIEKFPTIIQLWLPLTFAINSINRSMGLHDLYPFVIAAPVQKKLEFIHEVCYNKERMKIEINKW